MKKVRNVFYGSAILVLSHLQVSAQIKFEDVTDKSSIVDPLKGIMGHGAAWGDVNGDGYPDLFVGNFGDRPDEKFNLRGHTTGPEPDKLLINQGNGTFKEVMESPVRVLGRNSGAAFADFDDDGDLELVTSHQSYDGPSAVGTKFERPPGFNIQNEKPNNFLFENDGKGNFTDVTAKSGLDFGWPFMGRNTFVLDFDGDGLLDLLMQEDFVAPYKSGGNSRLMKNMGDLIFQDVTAQAGLPSGYRTGIHGLGGVVGDLNGDTWPDIFFAHTCRMFINNGDGTFHEKKYRMVPEIMMEPATINSNWTCGADMGDIDNDGDMDLVMGDHLLNDNPDHKIYIFLNEGNDGQGNPIYRDITAKAGIANIGGKAPHLQWQDFDNDGLLDLMTTNYDAFLYRNTGVVDGIPQFGVPIDSGAGEGLGYWPSGPLADYDRDGRVDFFGVEWEAYAPSRLLRNVSPNAGNYLDVRLDLKKSGNRNGIGATVEIFEKGFLGKKNGLLATRIISVSNGYSSGYEALAHFGLPHNETVDIRVTMPGDGKTYKKRNVKRNQLFVIH
ncbi:MAG: FG-GAP-like repeat-containing protein [Sediminicola sp.]